MKTRRVYSISGLDLARQTMSALRDIGIDDDDLALVARADIELEAIPDGRKEADTDLKPAALRGAGIGGATGLLAGLLAAVVPPLGITLAGAAVMTVAGAAIGGWASALIGSTVPDPIRRKFEQEIEAGRILLVVDAPEDLLAAEQRAVERLGGTAMPFGFSAAMR